MNFIKEISIYIKTNVNQSKKEDTGIPGETVSNSKSEYTLFTYSMIYQPPVETVPNTTKSTFEYNSKPFFTNYIKYSDYGLKGYFESRGYEEILKFFFNKSNFRDTLYKNGVELENVDYEAMNANSTANIEFMLELLFPTTFPSLNNIINSYNELFTNNSSFKISSWMNYLPQELKDFTTINNKFSYIKIGEQVKTIYRIVLINDIINHPKYKFLIKTIKQFTN